MPRCSDDDVGHRAQLTHSPPRVLERWGRRRGKPLSSHAATAGRCRRACARSGQQACHFALGSGGRRAALAGGRCASCAEQQSVLHLDQRGACARRGRSGVARGRRARLTVLFRTASRPQHRDTPNNNAATPFEFTAENQKMVRSYCPVSAPQALNPKRRVCAPVRRTRPWFACRGVGLARLTRAFSCPGGEDSEALPVELQAGAFWVARSRSAPAPDAPRSRFQSAVIPLLDLAQQRARAAPLSWLPLAAGAARAPRPRRGRATDAHGTSLLVWAR